MAERISISVGGAGSPRIVLGAPDPPRVSVHGPYVGSEVSPYDGPYNVTPTRETQVLATRGHRMGADVTVDPIPSNYGLITWNGSVLRVS